MSSRTYDILYSDKEYSVVVGAGDQYPSLLLTRECLSELLTPIMSEITNKFRSRAPDSDIAETVNLFKKINPILNQFFRESAEWRVKQPLPDDQKSADIVYLSTLREVERLYAFLNR